jgi:hypothetical protein
LRLQRSRYQEWIKCEQVPVVGHDLNEGILVNWAPARCAEPGKSSVRSSYIADAFTAASSYGDVYDGSQVL